MSETRNHAFLLKYKHGKKTTLQTWKSGNSSFDVVSSIERLSGVPVQVLWSNTSGRGWYKLGESLASRLHNVSYVSHNGGRWPQVSLLMLFYFLNNYIISSSNISHMWEIACNIYC